MSHRYGSLVYIQYIPVDYLMIQRNILSLHPPITSEPVTTAPVTWRTALDPSVSPGLAVEGSWRWWIDNYQVQRYRWSSFF